MQRMHSQILRCKYLNTKFWETPVAAGQTCQDLGQALPDMCRMHQLLYGPGFAGSSSEIEDFAFSLQYTQTSYSGMNEPARETWILETQQPSKKLASALSAIINILDSWYFQSALDTISRQQEQVGLISWFCN